MNQYNDVRLNIAHLIETQSAKLTEFNLQTSSRAPLNALEYLKSYLKLTITRFLVDTGLYKKLIYSNLKLDWFYEFNQYWVKELGNRPLQPHDFYFLYGSYRSAFSGLEIPEGESDEQHLQAWQDHRAVFLLFFNQYKLALNPLYVKPFIPYIPKEGHICEYGCGLAPIASSLCRYYPYLKVKITCADIPHLMFHFMRWKFRDSKYVKPAIVDPHNDMPLEDTYNTIFCMAVLEHLPRPLLILNHFYSRLSPGGYFIFDYIKSEGKGFDTVGALTERISALQYILDNFEVIKGRVPLDGSHVDAVVCRKPL